MDAQVVTALIVYGIEADYTNYLSSWFLLVATAPTVYGIETVLGLV